MLSDTIRGVIFDLSLSFFEDGLMDLFSSRGSLVEGTLEVFDEWCTDLGRLRLALDRCFRRDGLVVIGLVGFSAGCQKEDESSENG